MHQEHDCVQLHCDEYGYVVFCRNCRSFQLGYGTVCLNQEELEFQAFADMIRRYHRENAHRQDCGCRDIYINSPHPGMGLIFSPRDLEQLDNMLQKSLLILQSEDQIRWQ
ncbi:MAG: DUF6686 family protein [Bacteroidota bacterium]